MFDTPARWIWTHSAKDKAVVPAVAKTQWESRTFSFREPLNKERRFLPMRLDDAPSKSSLAQFAYNIRLYFLLILESGAATVARRPFSHRSEQPEHEETS